MSTPLLPTKLYIPPPRSKVVLRPRLTERLNEGLNRKLTLISASAGCGKTTLLSEWLASCELSAAWLSLEKEDNDPARFLGYLLAALQTVGVHMGEGINAVLQTTRPVPFDTILTTVLHKINAVPDPFILVLDDYHVVHSKAIDHAIAFLLEHMPPHLHLVIASREDPGLPIPRLRVRDQLTEMRTADLRFTDSEAAEFLQQVMGLSLSKEVISLLESRTEGWIAGLQLAALSMKGHQNTTSFIQSFSGSHHFVLDYLLEEVLRQQPARIQDFLLRTSILDRMCGPLCDAVLRNVVGEHYDLSASGQETLEYLERANLFIIPLDNERRWYRYHHLFRDLLQERLHRSMSLPVGEESVTELHQLASEWYEDHSLELEAFQHATAAPDVERAARLAEGKGMPLIFRGAAAPVLSWLDKLPREELDTKPSLYVMHASALLFIGQMNGVEQKLQAAEKALKAAGQDEDDLARDLKGHMASIRATLAVSKHQAETIIAQAHLALEYLSPDNLPVRTATMWALGYAYQLQGDRAAAGKAYSDAVAVSRKIGHFMIAMMSSLGLGLIQEAGNQLYAAAETYHQLLEQAGDPPLPSACEAHLGLARIFYEWNELDAAEQHGQLAVQLAKQLENSDRAAASEVFLAKLMLARGDASGAADVLAKVDHAARQQHFLNLIPHIAAMKVLVLLHEGNLEAASHLAHKHEHHISLARVHLAQGDTSAAIAVLETLRERAEAKGWEEERLQAMVLLAVALNVHGEKPRSAQVLRDAMISARAGGCIRTFIDEGMPMFKLLREAVNDEKVPDYAGKLLDAFKAEEVNGEIRSDQKSAMHSITKSLIEPLSVRELEILELIAQGLSNHEISERLFLALSTVKGYNRNIFDKLQVKRRTEAVAYARELGLL